MPVTGIQPAQVLGQERLFACAVPPALRIGATACSDITARKSKHSLNCRVSPGMQNIGVCAFAIFHSSPIGPYELRRFHAVRVRHFDPAFYRYSCNFLSLATPSLATDATRPVRPKKSYCSFWSGGGRAAFCVREAIARYSTKKGETRELAFRRHSSTAPL